MDGLINPPSSFSPTPQWRQFLDSLDPQSSDPEVKRLRSQAQDELARRQSAAKPWWTEASEKNPPTSAPVPSTLR